MAGKPHTAVQLKPQCARRIDCALQPIVRIVLLRRNVYIYEATAVSLMTARRLSVKDFSSAAAQLSLESMMNHV